MPIASAITAPSGSGRRGREAGHAVEPEATRTTGCAARASRCNVHDGVEVNVAGEVTDRVEVIVGTKVNSRGYPSTGAAGKTARPPRARRRRSPDVVETCAPGHPGGEHGNALHDVRAAIARTS